MSHIRPDSRSEPNSSASLPSIIIDYKKFNHERRISRPPGVPTIWNRPAQLDQRSLPKLSGGSSQIPSVNNSTEASLTKPFSLRSSPDDQETWEGSYPIDQSSVSQQNQNSTKALACKNNRLEKAPDNSDQVSVNKISKIQRNSTPIGETPVKPNFRKYEERTETNQKSIPTWNKPEPSRQAVQTMTIDELNLRHRTALKKLQGSGRPEINDEGITNNTEKIQPRENFEKELNKWRIGVIEAGIIQESSHTVLSKALPIQSKDVSSVGGSNFVRAGNISQGKKNSQIALQETNINNNRTQGSKRTWLDY